MTQLESYKEDLQRLGANVLYIAAEKREGLFKPEKFLSEHPVSFPFLLDEHRHVTKAYGVYHRIGIDAINIAHPATFVIDAAGRIRYIYVGASQTDRAPFDQVLQAVRDAKSKLNGPATEEK